MRIAVFRVAKESFLQRRDCGGWEGSVDCVLSREEIDQLQRLIDENRR